MKIIPRYQPIMDVWNGRVIGYEATMRGDKGERALELFERAKQDGQLVDLDLLARTAAIEAGMPMIGNGQRLFLNVSSETLQERMDDFFAGVPLDRIVLEITEQMPIRNLARVRGTLVTLCHNGLELALDDFGHGFTNVEMITELPLSYLKLDKVFARAIHRFKTAETVKWLVRMCQDAGIRFVVEGVETSDQRERLLDLGVRYMQGFFFGFPQPASHLSSGSGAI